MQERTGYIEETFYSIVVSAKRNLAPGRTTLVNQKYQIIVSFKGLLEICLRDNKSFSS